jgi:hypothetical protein
MFIWYCNGRLFWLSGVRGIHRHADIQQGDLISLLLFFQNKESRLKINGPFSNFFRLYKEKITAQLNLHSVSIKFPD